MTDEQINEAIAEACGWTDFVVHPQFGLMGTPPETHGLRTAVKYYTVDLNAMHEAEEYLRGNQFEQYAEMLDNIIGSLGGIRAIASERAEAFLRTLGKWDQAGDATEKEVQK